MRATSKSAEWIFLATNLGLEMLSAACDQASSPTKPHYALFGMLLAIAAVLISIWELIYRGKKERVVLRRLGMLWWFYHPPPPRHKPFGTLPDIYGLVAGISQCICSIVQYVYCLRHADSPFKASLLPAIFLMCLGGSRLSNKRINFNTTDNKDSWENSSSMEETSSHPIPEYYPLPIPEYYAPANIPFLDNQEVKRNIDPQEQELWQQQWQELELELEQKRQEQEQELEQKRQKQERELQLLLHEPNLKWLELELQLQELKLKWPELKLKWHQPKLKQQELRQRQWLELEQNQQQLLQEKQHLEQWLQEQLLQQSAGMKADHSSNK